MTQTLADVTDLEWAEMAKETKLTGPVMKDRMTRGVGSDDAVLPHAAGNFIVDGLCQSTTFSAAMGPDLRSNGQIILCGPEAHWSGKLKMTLHLFGVPIGAMSHQFDGRVPEVIGAIATPIFRTSYVLGVRPDRWCFMIKGRISQLTIDGWDEQPIKRTFFCFGEI